MRAIVRCDSPAPHRACVRGRICLSVNVQVMQGKTRTMGKTIGAAEFKATCLRVIDEMNRDHQLVTITKRGKPVAVLSPVKTGDKPASIWGAMRGTVLRYDDPFAPATDADVWTARRPTPSSPATARLWRAVGKAMLTLRGAAARRE